MLECDDGFTATDDLTVLIEMHDADLDPYADLSAYGPDVEGVRLLKLNLITATHGQASLFGR